MTRISRRLFLSGAALLGAGIALDRVGQTPTTVADQAEVLDEESPTPTSVAVTPEPTSTPVVTQEVVSVAAGRWYSLALTRRGEVVAWGQNDSGQTSVPSYLRDVVAVAAGVGHALAVTRSGEVVGWGFNRVGQASVPSWLRDVVAVAAGVGHSLAVTRSGEVVAWGSNTWGAKSVPSDLRDVVQVSAGNSYSLALKRDGTVVAWGGGNGWELSSVPRGLRDVVVVAGGYQHALALTRSGEVVAWGWNKYGQTKVPSELRDVVTVAAGYGHSLALTRSGEVVAWGSNECGETNVPDELLVSPTYHQNDDAVIREGTRITNPYDAIPTGIDELGRYFIGQADAPVTVIEYADFQSPGCAEYAMNVAERFHREYVATGKVKKIFHDFPLHLHPNAIGAAVAARCAGTIQGAPGFWKMHDMIYANQRQWSILNASYVTKQMITYAEQLQLDTEAFSSCLNDDAVKQVVLDYQKQSNALRLPGTPSFTVNGKVVDASYARSIEDIDVLVRQAVDAALK